MSPLRRPRAGRLRVARSRTATQLLLSALIVIGILLVGRASGVGIRGDAASDVCVGPVPVDGPCSTTTSSTTESASGTDSASTTDTVTTTDAASDTASGTRVTALGSPVATSLAFTQQPPSGETGVALTPPVTVAVCDPFGNTVTGDSSDALTISVASGPGAFPYGRRSGRQGEGLGLGGAAQVGHGTSFLRRAGRRPLRERLHHRPHEQE